MHSATRLFIALVLATVATDVSAQGWRDGDAKVVEGGKSWYPISCVRLLGYQIKPPVFTASKVRYGSSPESMPTAEQIRLALHAESSCSLPDTTVLPVTPEMRGNLIMTQHLARHMPARYIVDTSYEQRAIRALRQQGKFSLEDVFSQLCQVSSTRAYRAALARLTPGPAVAIDGLAWVPLLNSQGDIAGPGLVFFNEESWHYHGLSYVVQGLRVRPSKASEEIQEGLNSSATSSTEGDEEYFSRCPMPEAPEPLAWAQGYDLNIIPNFQMTDWQGENLLGEVQRHGIASMAQADHAKGTTELIFAEVQLRSLTFDDAPELGSALWLWRVEYAKQLIDSGLVNGADATRIAPLLRWLGNRYIVGEPGFKQDLGEATRLLRIAAKFGDDEAAEVYKSIQLGEIEVCNDHLHIPDSPFKPSPKPQVEALQACE